MAGRRRWLTADAQQGFASTSARVGLGLRAHQARSYYGLKINPKTVGEQARQQALRQSRLRAHAAPAPPRLGLILGGSLIAATGFSAFVSQPVACESARPYAQNTSPAASPASVDPQPESIVNVYQLSFGTACGFCAGVFIKKGLKLIAFALGGCYILLQYMNSQRLISVNWKAINGKYDKYVGSAAGPVDPNARGFSGSTAQRIWNRGTNFLMADFQQRATFMAGLLLGFRLG